MDTTYQVKVAIHQEAVSNVVETLRFLQGNFESRICCVCSEICKDIMDALCSMTCVYAHLEQGPETAFDAWNKFANSSWYSNFVERTDEVSMTEAARSGISTLLNRLALVEKMFTFYGFDNVVKLGHGLNDTDDEEDGDEEYSTDEDSDEDENEESSDTDSFCSNDVYTTKSYPDNGLTEQERAILSNYYETHDVNETCPLFLILFGDTELISMLRRVLGNTPLENYLYSALALMNSNLASRFYCEYLTTSTPADVVFFIVTTIMNWSLMRAGNGVAVEDVSNDSDTLPSFSDFSECTSSSESSSSDATTTSSASSEDSDTSRYCLWTGSTSYLAANYSTSYLLDQVHHLGKSNVLSVPYILAAWKQIRSTFAYPIGDATEQECRKSTLDVLRALLNRAIICEDFVVADTLKRALLEVTCTAAEDCVDTTDDRRHLFFSDDESVDTDCSESESAEEGSSAQPETTSEAYESDEPEWTAENEEAPRCQSVAPNANGSPPSSSPPPALMPVPTNLFDYVEDFTSESEEDSEDAEVAQAAPAKRIKVE